MSETLYDRDLQQWIEQTIQQLRNHEFEALDIEHLIEELVDVTLPRQACVMSFTTSTTLTEK